LVLYTASDYFGLMILVKGDVRVLKLKCASAAIRTAFIIDISVTNPLFDVYGKIMKEESAREY
jgi:hypothetical protein